MKKAIYVAVLSLSGIVSYAQNLNQTVKITNEYAGEVYASERVTAAMSVPDSLTSFNYKFDYSVFDAPYKGAYEFSPYAVKVAPESSKYDGNRFFLRAGAGYTLHPVLDACWQPFDKGKFRLSIDQSLSGYVGKYKKTVSEIGDYTFLTVKGSQYEGYDLSERFGVNGKWNVKNSLVSFGTSYTGCFTGDIDRTTAFNSVGISCGVKSAKSARNSFRYSVNLSVDLSSDKYGGISTVLGAYPLVERKYGLDASFGPVLKKKYPLLLDLDVKYFDYSANGADYVPDFCVASVKPRFIIKKGAFDLSAGIGLALSPSFRVYPDVKVSVILFKNALKLYALLIGGYSPNSYSSLKSVNHWFYAGYSSSLRQTYEKIGAQFGFCGAVASRFQYDLRAGWSSLADAAMWGFYGSSKLTPNVCFYDYNVLKVDCKLGWRSEHIYVDGLVSYRKTSVGSSLPALDLPAFSGRFNAVYNWKHRIFGGVSAEAVSPRKLTISGKPLEVQGYVDLGIYGEYRFSRTLSFWLKGSNLLCESIQRIPLHVEKGVNITAGICLKLQ